MAGFESVLAKASRQEGEGAEDGEGGEGEGGEPDASCDNADVGAVANAPGESKPVQQAVGGDDSEFHSSWVGELLPEGDQEGVVVEAGDPGGSAEALPVGAAGGAVDQGPDSCLGQVEGSAASGTGAEAVAVNGKTAAPPRTPQVVEASAALLLLHLVRTATAEVLAPQITEIQLWRNPMQQDLLFFAVQRGQQTPGTNCVLTLLCDQARLDVNSEDSIRQTPLFFAAAHGTPETVEFLVKRGADVQHRDENGQTALFYAGCSGCSLALRLLLDAGAPVDAADRNLQTALFYCSSSRSLSDGTPSWSPAPSLLQRKAECISILLLRNADVNQTDSNSQTPLFYAVLGDCPEACAALLDGGADPHVRDTYNKTPAMLCTSFANVASVFSLRSLLPAAPEPAGARRRARTVPQRRAAAAHARGVDGQEEEEKSDGKGQQQQLVMGAGGPPAASNEPAGRQRPVPAGLARRRRRALAGRSSEVAKRRRAQAGRMLSDARRRNRAAGRSSEAAGGGAGPPGRPLPRNRPTLRHNRHTDEVMSTNKGMALNQGPNRAPGLTPEDLEHFARREALQQQLDQLDSTHLERVFAFVGSLITVNPETNDNEIDFDALEMDTHNALAAYVALQLDRQKAGRAPVAL